MEGEFEEQEDLGEVSPSGDVERMIGGGCPAAGYKGGRRVSVDGGHQGITQRHLQLEWSKTSSSHCCVWTRILNEEWKASANACCIIKTGDIIFHEIMRAKEIEVG